MPITLEELVNAVGRDVGETRARAALAPVLEMLDEPVEAWLPSIHIGPDGPKHAAIFLLSASYLAEAKLDDGVVNFDVLNRNTIRNYRIRMFDVTLPKGESTVTYQVAEVTLLHDLGGAFESIIQYVGADRERWLQSLVSLIPIRTVLGNRTA